MSAGVAFAGGALAFRRSADHRSLLAAADAPRLVRPPYRPTGAPFGYLSLDRVALDQAQLAWVAPRQAAAAEPRGGWGLPTLLVVGLYGLLLWLIMRPLPIVSPIAQPQVIQAGLAADPAVAAARRAQAEARAAAEARERQAQSERQAAAAREQAQLEVSRLAEAAQLAARQKRQAPPRRSEPVAKRAPKAHPAPKAAAAPAGPANPQPTRAEPMAASSAGAQGAPRNVAASGSRQYQPLHKVAPVYPPAALDNEREGDCTVEYDLQPDGSIAAARLVPGECDVKTFGAASLKAVQGFRYAPQQVDGQPVRVLGVRNTFHYRLKLLE